MAEYLILIYADEDALEAAPAADAPMLAEHQAFGNKHHAALRGGNALQGTGTATTIRRDATGKPVVTDGAFAETKEALGGYYLIEAADLDEALRIAEDVPTSPGGGVEVRPIRTFS